MKRTSSVHRLSKKQLVASDDECSALVQYYFENGLRKVQPYYFKYKTYAKERWYNRPLLQIFSQEFRDKPIKYYVEPDYLLQNGDFMSHKIHRHEPPVKGEIQIVKELEGLIVINKPASIPAHPSGRYRYNSVVEILKREKGFKFLSSTIGFQLDINRLDRLTSGLMLLGTNAATTDYWHSLMRNGNIKKEYVCKVDGKFPDGIIECNEPITVTSHSLGLCAVDPKGKPSCTTFERLSYDGHHSLLKCVPISGRTHQIRVHLQFLGYPISNDPLYNIAFRGSKEPIEHEEESIDKQLAAECYECKNPLPDPTEDQLCIYLHSYKYQVEDLSFQVPLPNWAIIAEMTF